MKTNLLEHQQKAYDKLKSLTVGALFMEMGTGKTRTALELIKLRLDNNKVDYILWLCPCRVKKDLKLELSKHTDIKVDIVGIETLSTSIRENSRLLDLVQSKKVYLIVDESSLVKNKEAIRTQNIIRLSQYCKYKLILNGTPISRSMTDLFSQMYILDWRILGYKSFWSFARNHLEYDDKGQVSRVLNTDYITSKIAPYSYQVTKDECLKLPPKINTTKSYYLPDKHREHYNRVADKFLFELDELKPHTIYRLITALQLVISGFYISEDEDKSIIKTKMYSNPYDNPRIQALLENIANNKTIIYCKYIEEVKDIEKVLSDRFGKDKVITFYGNSTKREKDKAIENFKGNKDFFIATKQCAGYGLNLQFCNRVIYYNNDYDLATRLQSEDRVHRIGQGKTVYYTNICASNTLDEAILKSLLRKENLLDEFRREVKKKKDKTSIHNYIYGPSYSKKGSYKKEIEIRVEDDLKE